MSFRFFFGVGTQFFENDGEVLANGSLTFTDSGTTTLRSTWSDPGMTVLNPNPVPLDGAGRPNVDIWGDGSYRVVLKDALGAVIGTADNVSGPQGIPDPALQSGKFLTNDGTNIFWAAIEQVPNPTGQPDGYVLTTDGGGNIQWEAIPSQLNNAALTGNPTAPTPAPGDNDTSIATTAFVTAAITASAAVSVPSGFVPANGVGANLPAGWSASRLSVGLYRVTHNLALPLSTALRVTASMADGRLVDVINLGNFGINSFDVFINLATDVNQLRDRAFYFVAARA